VYPAVRVDRSFRQTTRQPAARMGGPARPGLASSAVVRRRFGSRVGIKCPARPSLVSTSPGRLVAPVLLALPPIRLPTVDERWRDLTRILSTAGLGSGPGVATAALLSAAALAPSTRSAYTRLWDAFARFCSAPGRRPMPASPATVAAYVGSIFDGGAVQGTSLRPCLAAIAAFHNLGSYVDPTKSDLVARCRAGYLRRLASAPPPRHVPLPASVASGALSCALSIGPAWRCGAGVTVGFLLCARPSSLVGF
jgi:hypothetical protein